MPGSKKIDHTPGLLLPKAAEFDEEARRHHDVGMGMEVLMEDVESEARRYVAALYMADPLVEIVSVSPEALKFAADKGWLTTDTDGGHGISDKGIHEVLNA